MSRDLEHVVERLAAWTAGTGWVGPDPYEGLNTPAARLAPGKRGRQVVTQVYKRLPVQPPWPLRTPPRPNAKVFGLVLSAYSNAAGGTLDDAAAARTGLRDRLSALRLRAGGGWGWGYPFDAQTRHALLAHSAPNVVATSFAVGGLLDLHDHDGDEEALELALGSRPVLCSMFRREDPVGPHFAYAASAGHLVHNANGLVCGALARMNRYNPDERATALVLQAVQTTLAAQDETGLWPYGEAANLRWADNFHTAYVLEGLVAIADEFGVGEAALATGLNAWRARFLAGGDAGLYPDSLYPLEAHSYASAIDLCCAAASREPSLLDYAEKIAERAIERLWLEREGRFAYRVTRLGTNKRVFMRWTNAPMLRALTRLLTARAAQAA